MALKKSREEQGKKLEHPGNRYFFRQAHRAWSCLDQALFVEFVIIIIIIIIIIISFFLKKLFGR